MSVSAPRLRERARPARTHHPAGGPRQKGDVARRLAGTAGKAVGGLLVRVWVPAAIVVAWELATRRVQNFFFPPPSQIITTTKEVWFSGPLTHAFLTPDAIANLLPSLARLLGGWVAGSVIAILIGVALGRSGRLLDYANPLLHFCRSIPPAALLPVFMVPFRLGTQMQLAVIIFGVIWPVLLNTIEGVRSIDTVQIDTANAFRISGPRRLTRVILPAAAPMIFAGMRLSLTLSLILMVLSELVGSTNGLGYQMQDAMRNLDYSMVWGVILILGVAGYALNVAFLAGERRMLDWHRAARRG
jgi:ABC-type nitrate/sulfonate/bicarbonate transport system permease component